MVEVSLITCQVPASRVGSTGVMGWFVVSLVCVPVVFDDPLPLDFDNESFKQEDRKQPVSKMSETKARFFISFFCGI